MFFIHVMGRCSSSKEVDTLEELGEVVSKAMISQANNAIVVSVGLDDSAVMPYVWIHRNIDTDEWEGELGDCIKLGIDDGLLIEYDPIQMLNLDQAIARGIAEVVNNKVTKTVAKKSEPPVVKPQVKKLSPGAIKFYKENEDKILIAKKMVKDLFARINYD